MSDLAAIVALYQQVDNSLDALRERCDADEERDRVARQQRLNEQAWFVLAWGQFEAAIDATCRDAIRNGQSHEEWRYRRAWNLYDPDNLRLSFRNRLMLVLDHGSADWKRIVELYEVRNQIAHGALRSEGIDVSTIVEDFSRIQSSLARE